MLKEEIWSISIQRARSFFREQEDVLELLATATIMKDYYAEIPFIVISMGELGTNTRVCGGEFGSVMTFAAGKKASAPGQIGAVQLKQLLDKYYGEEESK